MELIDHIEVLSDEPDTCLQNLGARIYSQTSGKVAIFLLDSTLGLLVQRTKFNPSFGNKILVPSNGSSGNLSGAVSYFWRGNLCVGAAVNVDGSGITPKIHGLLSVVLPFVYNRQQHLLLVTNLPKNIDLELSSDEYHEALGSIAKDSSGAPLGAYREYDKNSRSYRPLIAWGIKPDETLGNSHLEVFEGEIDEFDAARRTGKTQVCEDFRESYPKVANRLKFKTTRMFCVTPVKVNREFRGLLTFGFEFSFEPTPTEKQSYLCIANAIGVSLSNYQYSRQAKTASAEFEKITASMVGVEVTQSIRHSLYQPIENCLTYLNLMTPNTLENLESTLDFNVSTLSRLNDGDLDLSSLGPKDLSKSNKLTLNYLDRSVREIELIRDGLNQMRTAMTFEKIIASKTAHSIFGECVKHLSAKLDEERIKVTNSLPQETCILLPDIIRNLFHNLLINSIDALQRSGKSNRRISVSGRLLGGNSPKLVATFTDNGPGFDQFKLFAQMTESEISKQKNPLEKAMDYGVTTKRNGSGAGLHLCRRMTSAHNGSISPFDNKPGARFEISIGLDASELLNTHNGKLMYIDAKSGEKRVFGLEKLNQL